jgi:hypothetical protein
MIAKKTKKLVRALFAFAGRSVTQTLTEIEAVDFLQKHLYSSEKYQNSGRLNRYEFSAFSQNGEDGIIEEIFNRIGVTNQFFVEFGTESGVETNSTYLLYKGWQGVFMDGSGKNIEDMRKHFSNVIAQGRLQAFCSFITAENIENLLENANVPKELDFLSVDVDRNDYYIWEAIKTFRPRVVCIEYNAVFRPGCEFVVPYEPTAVWDGTSNFGASIESLCKLGIQKGYKLVACCFAGVNAFFVREDLINDRFAMPFSPEYHYEPPRYFLGGARGGHPRRIAL